LALAGAAAANVLLAVKGNVYIAANAAISGNILA